MNADGKKVSVPIMKQEGMKINCAVTPYFTKINLPTESDIIFQLFVPAKGNKLSGKREVLELKKAFDEEETIYLVNQELPRFKIYNKKDLGESLRKLGVSNIFDNRKADFSRIIKVGKKDYGLCVNNVRQDNAISVNELGLFACAVMSIEMGVIDYLDTTEYKTLDIKVDRPFYYCIRSEYADVIYFIGKVNQLSDISE